MGTEADGAATPLAEPLAVSLLVARLLDGLGVRYLVGGSVASSLLGLPRATLNSDMVADLDIAHAAPLVAALGDGFYADEDAIRDAIRRRSSFNVIHLATAFKVDVFVLRRDPYSASEMDRRVTVAVGPSPSHTIWVATAEDMVLQMLDWFRRGGGVSASRRSAQWSAASEALRPAQTWMPPEASIRWPLIQPLRSSSSMVMAPPMSSGRPTRPRGVCPAII